MSLATIGQSSASTLDFPNLDAVTPVQGHSGSSETKNARFAVNKNETCIHMGGDGLRQFPLAEHAAQGDVGMAEDIGRRGQAELVDGVIQGRACRHGHQGAGYAVACAIHQADQEVGVMGMKNIEISSDDITRSPQDEMPEAKPLGQLAIRQKGTLNKTGIVDGIVDFLMGLAHQLHGRIPVQRSFPAHDFPILVCVP